MFKIWIDYDLNTDLYPLLNNEAELIGPLIHPDPQDPLNELEDADAVIAGPLFPGVADSFERAKKLKVVARFGIGYDSINLDDATKYGICATNTPDAPTEPTAEMTITLMLAAVKQIKKADQFLTDGSWPDPIQFMSIDLEGKTLGVVGLGRVGGRVSEIAKALHMQVIAHDPYIEEERFNKLQVQRAPDLQAVLGAADILTVHAPLNDETRGLIGAHELSQLKKGAFLINAARGPVVVQSALIDALQSGHLAGAGLDVWDPEPPKPDNPLLKMDNVVKTPHIAARTVEGRERCAAGVVQCALTVLKGERPANLLNPEVWDHRRT